MKVVRHETIGMHLPTGLLAGFAQGLEKAAVRIVLENPFAAVPAVHQVVNGARVLDSQLARHGKEDSRQQSRVSIVMTDPFPGAKH